MSNISTFERQAITFGVTVTSSSAQFKIDWKRYPLQWMGASTHVFPFLAALQILGDFLS